MGRAHVKRGWTSPGRQSALRREGGSDLAGARAGGGDGGGVEAGGEAQPLGVSPLQGVAKPPISPHGREDAGAGEMGVCVCVCV